MCSSGCNCKPSQRHMEIAHKDEINSAHKMADKYDTFLYKLLRFLAIYWRGIFTVVWPLVCLPIILLHDRPEFRCMYVVCVMGGFWVTEALPLPISSTLPIVMFPLMGILDTETTCMCYFKETNVMFLGGIMIAIAIEYSNLHNRIAMATILFVGCSPRKLHFGLTFMTMFISMWISNTAATAMMCPIIVAVLTELESQGLGDMYIKEDVEKEKVDDENEKRPSDTTICYFLSAAYASSIGGIGTLVGTGTNLTFRGIFETRFTESDGVNFTTWMIFNIPSVLCMTMATWIWLQVMYMGLFRPNSTAGKMVQKGVENQNIAREVIKKKYKELGRVSWHETMVGLLFLLSVCLWFFRQPGFVTGWAERITSLKVKDATPSLFVVLIMFLIPAEPTFLNAFSSDPEKRPTKPSPGLLTWKVLNAKMPWGLMFLLGGGFALAEGSKHSGMSEFIGDSLIGLKVLPPVLILIIVCLIASALTELSSNVAIANILLPVLAEMSVALKIHPMYLMMPAAICCSFAFMLPVGTPSNAIITGIANIRSADMAKAGFGVSIITMLIVLILFPTWGAYIYPLHDFPTWAKSHHTV